MGTMRKYSIDEIDQMRRNVEILLELAGSKTIYNSSGRAIGYRPKVHGPTEQRSAVVEDRLRTYMMASVDPAEIETKVKQETKLLMRPTSPMRAHLLRTGQLDLTLSMEAPHDDEFD